MSRARKREVQLSLLLAVGGAVACSPYPSMKDVPVDCSPQNAVDLAPAISLVAGDGTPNFWTSTDTVVGTATTRAETLPDGALCGNTSAVVLRSDHNTDWGSLFGYNGFGGPTGRDASMYEGLSFWARAPGNTTKAFTILLDDPDTDSPDANPATGLPMDGGVGKCTKYASTDGGTQNPSGTVVNAEGMPVSGVTTNAPPPDACGNGYSTVVVLTIGWRFYTIPFSVFQQGRTPNKVPNSVLMGPPGSQNGLITSALLNLVLRMPKEADMELWLSHLSFYRKKALGAGADGGTDAPRM